MCDPARPLVEFSVFESFGGTLMDSDVPVGIFGVFVMLSTHVHVSDAFVWLPGLTGSSARDSAFLASKSWGY